MSFLYKKPLFRVSIEWKSDFNSVIVDVTLKQAHDKVVITIIIIILQLGCLLLLCRLLFSSSTTALVHLAPHLARVAHFFAALCNRGREKERERERKKRRE